MRGRVMILAAGAGLTMSACGSSGPPPAAEPARSPALTGPPAGTVIAQAGGPEGIVADSPSGLVAVALRRPARLILIEMRTHRIARVVRLPGPARHLALAAPGGPVLVPAERADALVEVALPSGAARTIVVGSHPHDSAAVGSLRFVGDEFGDRVTVIKNGRVIASRPAPRQPGGVVASEGRVGVVGVRDRRLALYDSRSLRTLATRNAGVGPTHVAAGPDGRLYVVDTQGDAILIFATRPSLRLVARTTLAGAPYGIAVDARRNRLWVTLTARNQVAWVRLRPHRRPRVMMRLPTVRQPNSVAVDPRSGRVWIAGRRPGALEEIDPGSVR